MRVPPRPANFCILKIETGFNHVGQAGLELLTSGDLPTLASQSAEITHASHSSWPEIEHSPEQQSPTFLAPVTGFVEDNFSTTSGWGGQMVFR